MVYIAYYTELNLNFCFPGSNYVQNMFWQSGNDSKKFLNKEIEEKNPYGSCDSPFPP